MKRLALILTVLVLVGCGGGGPSIPVVPPPTAYPNVLPSSPLWQMTAGTWAEYSAQVMHGTFNPLTGMIENVTLSGEPWQNNRVTNIAYHMPMDAAQVGIARVHTIVGVAAGAVDPALKDVLLERTTGFMMGEAANAGALAIDPPEPLITLNPVPGEVIVTNSTVTGLDGKPFLFTTRYQTIAVGVPEQDGFQNVTITTLVEQPQGNATAYVQVFDGDIAEIIYGAVANDNTVEGIVAKRIRQGVVP